MAQPFQRARRRQTALLELDQIRFLACPHSATFCDQVKRRTMRMRFAGLAVAVVLFVAYWAAPVAQVADSLAARRE
jgi:hypothetical protein